MSFSKPSCSEGAQQEGKENAFEVTCCFSDLPALLASSLELKVPAEGAHFSTVYRDLRDTLPAPALVFPALFFPSLELLAVPSAIVLLFAFVLSCGIPIAAVLFVLQFGSEQHLKGQKTE